MTTWHTLHNTDTHAIQSTHVHTPFSQRCAPAPPRSGQADRATRLGTGDFFAAHSRFARRTAHTRPTTTTMTMTTMSRMTPRRPSVRARVDAVRVQKSFMYFPFLESAPTQKKCTRVPTHTTHTATNQHRCEPVKIVVHGCDAQQHVDEHRVQSGCFSGRSVFERDEMNGEKNTILRRSPSTALCAHSTIYGNQTSTRKKNVAAYASKFTDSAVRARVLVSLLVCAANLPHPCVRATT